MGVVDKNRSRVGLKLAAAYLTRAFVGVATPRAPTDPLGFLVGLAETRYFVWSAIAIYKFWMVKVVSTTCAEPRLPT